MLDQQREYVLRSVEERGVRLIRLWFTDILGNLKSFAISPAELENALDDGMTFDGSSIDGFSRIQEADVLAIPDPDTFEVLPWGDAKTPEARVFCDIHNLDGTPFDGDPRQVLRRHVRAVHDQGLTFYVAPDIEFFYFNPPEKGHVPRPLDEGVVLRPHDERHHRLAAQADHPHAGGDGDPRRVQLPRGRAGPAGDRPAPHRRPVDGRQRDDVPADRAGGGGVARRARHVHAQAAGGRPGLRDAHPPVAVPRRRQRLLRRRRRLPPVAVRQVVHGRAAAPRRRDHRHHQPDGQQLQAAGARASRRRSTSRGPATTAAA